MSATSANLSRRTFIGGALTASLLNGSAMAKGMLAASAEPVVDPRFWGVKGDGLTDDSAAIQACITASAGRRVLFRPGNYKITAPLRIVKAIVLDFESGATLLLATRNMNGIEIGDGTEPARDATFGTRILHPVFNPFPGTQPFTAGACIQRNYVAFCTVANLTVFGRDKEEAKLFTGVFDYRASECDTPDARIQYVRSCAVHCKGDGTTRGRTVDCNYDNLRATDVETGILIDSGCAGLGFYRPTIYGIAAGGNGIRIDCLPGPNGQNFFIDSPDIEAGPAASAAIDLHRGQKAIVNGGWVGASMGYGLKIGAGFDSAVVSCSFVQSKVVIDGPHNTIAAGEIVGDAASRVDGLLINGENTVIASGVKIRQWGGQGIAWGRGKPSGVLIGSVHFANNGTDIAPLDGFTPSTAPVIAQGSTDKQRVIAAAAILPLPITVAFARVTGQVPIRTIPVHGAGSRITLQADAGEMTLVAGGNLTLPRSPMIVAAFNTVSLVCDGASWFFDGKSAASAIPVLSKTA